MEQSAGQLFFPYPHRGVPVDGGPAISTLYTVHFFAGEMDYAVPGEVHPFWEMIYMDFGLIEVFGQGWARTLPAGSLMLIEPDVPHGFRVLEGQMYNMFILSFDCRDEGMRQFEGRQVFTPGELVKQLIGRIVRQARMNFQYPLDRISSDQIRLKKTADPNCLQIIRRMAELVLLTVRADVRGERPFSGGEETLHAQPSVVRTVQYLRQHVDGPVTLRQLCTHVGVSPSHLQNLFKRDIGITIMQYHRFLRIGKAKYLIRQQKYTMSEVAEMVGFSSVHHFSTCFRQTERLSPTQYAATVSKWIEGESGP